MKQKVIFLFTIAMLFKLTTSCLFRCDCPEPEEVEFNLNTSEIALIDNSGYYPYYNSTSDTIPSRAIGFSITLSDSSTNNIYYGALPAKYKPGFSSFIKGAYAWSCDCEFWNFTAKQKLKDIKFTTLSDFNEEIPANTDISHLLVGTVNEYNFDGHGMYKSLNNTISYLAQERNYSTPILSFELYLTQAPESDSIRFEITYEFDDNSSISDTTKTIYPNLQIEP